MGVGVLRLTCRAEGAGPVVDMVLEGIGARRSATARLGLGLKEQDREDMRWYLEDYLQYPAEPAPQIARRVEGRLAVLGKELFTQVFRANDDTRAVWNAVSGALADTRVEIVAEAEGLVGVPWELLRDPVTNEALALRAEAFVRAQPETASPVLPDALAGALRILLVICRPDRQLDVPFRSVARHLLRLSTQAQETFQLDVLRPPTFEQLTRTLADAKAAGAPYRVVHFDGHGDYLDLAAQTPASAVRPGTFSAGALPPVSPPRPGAHGYLVFEDGLVDGPGLGEILADAGVTTLVLNACRSAHADLVGSPATVIAEAEAHRRVQAYGSLAQEVMDAGLAGVVAMRYNVYVGTAARFIGGVYAALLDGRPLGAAVTAARRQLADDSLRRQDASARPLHDWLVPVVYEAAPLAFETGPAASHLAIELGQAKAESNRERPDPPLLPGPDTGFSGRDETLLALDRTFDTRSVVLLHGYAGAGKTVTALEFARWYRLTGGVADALFTQFTSEMTLERLLGQARSHFWPAVRSEGPQRAALGEGWEELGESQRRESVVQVLEHVPVLWVWDNVEQEAGAKPGIPEASAMARQQELKRFLDDLTGRTRCKVLLTSRRTKQEWLGDLPQLGLPKMPMPERLELAQAAADQDQEASSRDHFLDAGDWRPLLEFTQGNPLTITILVRQAIRDRRTTRTQLETFVAELAVGAAKVADDAAQGRSASLAASLDYGFSRAFTKDEHAVLALLALFQGFVDIGDLCRMGTPGLAGGPVPAAAGLDRAAWIGLLDRAAGIGLLTAYGNGYYAVHPAIPWHLHSLFSQHYGAPGSPAALQAIRAWTTAISGLGDHCHRQYEAGHADVIRVLTLNEANLLRARSHALEHRWLDLILGVMRGLRALYENTGRRVEWRQLVSGVLPSLTDAASDGPFPGLEHEWAVLTSYRVAIARQAQDWPAAGQLQHALLSWRREWAAAALATPAGQLDDEQRGRIRILAAVLHDLGQILREQNNPGCLLPYQEAAGLCQLIGARREEVTIALNIGAAYLDVPALRDLDQAEFWYRRNLELEEPHDTLNHARVTGQLARVAYERFFSARGAGAEDEQVRAQRNDAAEAYHRAIASFPADAVSDLAISHGQLGFIYGDAGDINQALHHYRQAIQYREREDNRFAAGNLRYTVALDLEKVGRTDDAVLYARAALRDYESGGPGAAAHADDARGLMARLAVALVNLSVLLASKGQQQEALTAIQRAVEIHEQVAETSPDAYLPALATSLDNLSVLLSVVGRREEGLTQSRRTVTIWEKLATVNPDAYRPNLAAALSNLSNRLGQAGQRADGLAANQRALGIYEQLAVASPDAYLPELAKSLTNLSGWLGDLGRPEEALAAIQRAVAIREPLAEANPDAYLPDLAASLNNLSNQLSRAGQQEEALAAIQRAVAIREPLAEANPDAYGSHLAMSLSNLSVRLGGLGRRVEALAAIQRAVAIQELLAEANPDAYLPDLAASLNNLSNQLSQAGQLEEALAAIRRAVAIREQQAAANPDAYRPNLARALNNLSRQLCGAGRWEEALAVIQRVVEIYEQLAETSPAAHLPDLALSLNNLAVPLANTGRQEEALAAIQRAVTIRETLAEMSPDAHLPDLAVSLHNLSMPLAAAGRQEEGLAAIQRAITIRRKLAERQPQAYEPDLAQSLLVLADRLFDANDPVAAVEPILTAATLADRWHRQDLISPAGQRLRKARISQPEAVTAEYERLTGSLWPQPGA